MLYFEISSNIPGAQIYLLKGFERTLIGATPMQLDMQQFGGSQIVIAYDNKEKAIYLDPSNQQYFVDFGEVRSDFNKYGIYLNGHLQYVNINHFEDLLRLGNKFDTVYVDNKMKMINELPELKVINDRYYPAVDQKNERPTVENTYSQVSQNQTTDYTLLYVVLGMLFIGGLVWFVTANTKKTETVETASAVDSAAVALVDSAATVVDSASVATVTPEMEALAAPVQTNEISFEEQQKNNLRDMGVSTFNDYSATKPNYDGCGSYFSLDKTANENGDYIFTGMISSFFSNNTEGAYVEMVIDGQVEHFSYYESGKNGNYIFLRGTGMTLEINLNEIGTGEEAIIYQGNATLNKQGNITKFNIYGISGC